jgi:hypothetical protein
MANNLFVAYDLQYPDQHYDRVIAAIKKLGAWRELQRSLWYVESTLSADQALKAIQKAADPKDRLIVINTTGNSANWYNLIGGDTTTHFLRIHWYD